MIAPLFEYKMFGETTSLFIAVIIGIFFGLFLERGGLGNPHKLTGVFYLTDFTVPKVMFTAILVASLGLYLLADLKLLDLNKIWFVPAYLWPQFVGGALFGVGFLISGYCPGTAVAGLASGRIDALITMIGIGIGSILFAFVYPVIESFYMYSNLGAVTLPHILGINHWFVIVFVFIFAGAMFYVMEKYERKKR